MEMRKISNKELKEILEKHQEWLREEDGGEKADLRDADLICANLSDTDLHGVDLSGTDLSCADLSGANLHGTDLSCADLSGANLHGANLICADLSGANLHGANLSHANLRYADLHGADLSSADLHDANLDYSCLPLWCGSLQANFDDRQLIQIAYHLVKAGLNSKNASDGTKKELSKLIDFANKFHRVDECGIIETEQDVANDKYAKGEKTVMDYDSIQNYIGDYLGQGVLEKALEQCRADGCEGCTFLVMEEWQDPCRRCRRNSKDYWRKATEK